MNLASSACVSALGLVSAALAHSFDLASLAQELAWVAMARAALAPARAYARAALAGDIAAHRREAGTLDGCGGGGGEGGRVLGRAALASARAALTGDIATHRREADPLGGYGGGGGVLVVVLAVKVAEAFLLASELPKKTSEENEPTDGLAPVRGETRDASVRVNINKITHHNNASKDAFNNTTANIIAKQQQQQQQQQQQHSVLHIFHTTRW